MSHVEIKTRRRVLVLKKEDVTLPVKKLVRSLKKRPEKKRFLLVEMGEPIDGIVNPKYAVLKLSHFVFDSDDNLHAVASVADHLNPTVSTSEGKLSLGQIMLSSATPMFEFKTKSYKRPVLKNDKQVYDEQGRAQYFRSCYIYIVNK